MSGSRLKRLLDRALFIAFSPTIFRGGIDPEQQANVIYFQSSAASAREGQQRIVRGQCAPVAPRTPFVTRAREETR